MNFESHDQVLKCDRYTLFMKQIEKYDLCACNDITLCFAR